MATAICWHSGKYSCYLSFSISCWCRLSCSRNLALTRVLTIHQRTASLKWGATPFHSAILGSVWQVNYAHRFVTHLLAVMAPPHELVLAGLLAWNEANTPTSIK